MSVSLLTSIVSHNWYKCTKDITDLDISRPQGWEPLGSTNLSIIVTYKNVTSIKRRLKSLCNVVLSIRDKMTLSFKDHRCTQVENPGEGVAQIFEWGVKAFQTKLPRESPILGFTAFLITSSLKKISFRGPMLYPLSRLTPSTMCIPSHSLYVHLCLRIWPYCHYWPSEKC